MHRIRAIYFLAQSNWRVDSITVFACSQTPHNMINGNSPNLMRAKSHTQRGDRNQCRRPLDGKCDRMWFTARNAHDRDDKRQTKVDAVNIIYDKWYRKLTANLTAKADYTNLSFAQSCELQITSSPSRTIYEAGVVNSERTHL